MDSIGTWLSHALHLRKLPPYLYTIILSFLGFTFVQLALGPLTWRLCGMGAGWDRKENVRGTKEWKRRNREKNNWSIHVASLIHAIIIIPLSLSYLSIPALDKDRAFGWDDRVGKVYGIACGYFLWDSVESIVHFTDIAFVVHGLSCLAIYAMAFKPFLAYYGTRFLLWEISTPFLNIHWFLDKLGLTGSLIQLINGLCLLTTFFTARILYGAYMSFMFFQTLRDASGQLSVSYILVYGVGNVVLNGLNWVWFFRMITALRKRFEIPGRRVV